MLAGSRAQRLTRAGIGYSARAQRRRARRGGLGLRDDRARGRGRSDGRPPHRVGGLRRDARRHGSANSPRVADFFGFDAGRALAAIAAGPLMSRYSKALEYEYSASLRRELIAEAQSVSRPRHRRRACHARARRPKSRRCSRGRWRDAGGGLMYRVLQILTDAEVAECRRIAAAAPFVDGRITNPHNKAKQNEQLHDAGRLPEELASCCSRRCCAQPGVPANSPSRWRSRRR